MTSDPREFSWPVRVYYEDTDSGGVVYYANYLKFMERARTELLRSVGYEQDKLQQESGLIFAVHSADINYRKPARFNDELNVITSIASLGKASIQFDQSVELVSSNHDDSHPGTLATARIKIACLDSQKFSPVSIPSQIVSTITEEFGLGN